ncbi:MAG: O-antigen ligase family protein [Solirubrobacteraceae bacterium]
MRGFDRTDALALLAGLPVLAVFAWWMADDGGYAPAAWMPGLVVVAVVLVIAVALGIGRSSRAALVAGAALTAYTMWSFASILWADAPGPALEGSQRTLLYLVCFACFALLPWTPRALVAVLALFVATITVIGLVTLLRVAHASDPARFFFEARLIGPLGYPNASAALWTSGALVALVLAARRESVAWLRPLSLGASGLLLGLAVTTESRGWLFTLPLVLLCVLLLVPGRARVILYAAPVVAGLAAISADLLAPYRSATEIPPAGYGATLASAFDAATRSLLLATAALVAIGVLMVFAEGRLRGRLTASRGVRRGLTAALLVGLAAACFAAAMVATGGRPIERVDRAWTELESYQGEVASGSRFSSLGSNRYDLWRVAFDAWREHPIGGLGQDNFGQTYVAQRQNSFDEPRWVHSLPLRLLTHTGVVGALLFMLFAVAVLWGALMGHRKAGTGTARLGASAALLPAVVWIAHGSVDWFWEYPALSGPAFALAGAATALSSTAAVDDRSPSSARVSRPRIAGVCVAGLACVALVLPSYVADRHVQEAAARWPANPDAAFGRLERARDLNPLSAHASLVEGVIAVRLGRLSQAHVSFTRAARREPHDWFARFELGLVAGARRDHTSAVRHLLVASRLNPRDVLIAQALLLARRGRTMSFQTAQEEFALRVQRLSGRFDSQRRRIPRSIR